MCVWERVRVRRGGLCHQQCLVCIPSLLSLGVTVISEPSFLCVPRVIYAFVMVVVRLSTMLEKHVARGVDEHVPTCVPSRLGLPFSGVSYFGTRGCSYSGVWLPLVSPSTELGFSIYLLFGNTSKHYVPSILRGEGCPSLQEVCGPVKLPVRKPAMQILWSRPWERKSESFGAVETRLLPQVWGLREGPVMVWGVHVAE